jgi:glutamate formiminotransferase
VSLNVENWRASPLHEVVRAVEQEASARELRVTGSELVGLLPAGAVMAAAGSAIGLRGLDPSRVLELRLVDE